MVFGITGTDGAGKGTAVEYLVDHYGFTHYSSRDFIVKHIEAAGLSVDRNQMRLTANELRAQHGNEFVVKQAYEQAQIDGVEDCIIESLRALAEAEYLKAQGGILIAVDASPEIRYERVQSRRSVSDQVSYEQFLEHEELEKNDPDPHGMQKAKVMEMADYTVMNNGSREELCAQIDDVMQQITHGNDS